MNTLNRLQGHPATWLVLTLPLTLTLLVPTLLGVATRSTARARQARDVGASTVEIVMWIAVLAAVVVTVAVILTTKLTTKANELDLTTP